MSAHSPYYPFLLTCIVWCFCSVIPLWAGHIVGGEFTYSCRGWRGGDPGSGVRVYAMRINMFRDNIGQGAYFDGVADDNTTFDGLSSAAGHISIYRGTTLVEPTRGIRLGPVAPIPINLGNPCLVLTEPVDQQVGIYEFEVELPVSDEAYTLVYQRCCRNDAIINLQNADEIGTTYFITITPESQTRCNESPVFTIDPPIAFCVNQPFQIDMSAGEREGDSLVYKLCNPIIGAGRDGLPEVPPTDTPFDDLVPIIESPPPYTNADFVQPQFDAANQLGQGSAFGIDRETGLLTGLPIFRGTFALAICVEEWSRGPDPVLLSETKREFQLTVNLCGTQIEADLLESSIDDQGRFFIRQCGPGPNTIINESTNVDFIDNYAWELQGPDGNLTGAGRDFSFDIGQTGEFPGIMILNRNSPAENCRDTAVFVLGIYPELYPDFEFVEPGCDDEPIEFTDLSTVQEDNLITEWRWNFQDGTADVVAQNPTHRYDLPGLYAVQLLLTDNNDCTADTAIDVTYFPTPRTIILEPDNGFGCVPFTKSFVNLSRPINDEYLFDWSFGDGGVGDVASPTHVYDSSGLFDVYLGITSPTGCFVDTTFRALVDVRDAPVADFFWEPLEPTNLEPDFTVFDASSGANRHRYEIRDLFGNLRFTTPQLDFDYSTRDTSSFDIFQYVTHPSGCVDTIQKRLTPRYVNTFFAPNAFTPNGDGLNDEFVPTGLFFGITAYQFRVWTRWGELIFRSDDPSVGWNGTYKGSNSPGGGYLWDAAFIDVEGELKEYKGGVVLVR